MNSVPHSEMPWAVTERARALIELGRPADAVPLLLQALGQSPENARALCLLSLAHGNQGKYSEAQRWAEQAISADPDGEWGHRLLAIHRLNQGNGRSALAPAQEAVRLAPEEPLALQVLARVQLRLNQMRDAADTTERLRRLAPNSFVTHETFGLVAIRQRRMADAEAHCRRALALKPDSYYAHNNLGVSLLNRPAQWPGKHLAEAVQCFDQATRINPSDPLARRNLSLALNRFLTLKWLFLTTVFLVSQMNQAGIGAAGPPRDIALLTAFLWVALAVRAIRRYRSLTPALRAAWRRTWWRPGELLSKKVR